MWYFQTIMILLHTHIDILCDKGLWLRAKFYVQLSWVYLYDIIKINTLLPWEEKSFFPSPINHWVQTDHVRCWSTYTCQPSKTMVNIHTPTNREGKKTCTKCTGQHAHTDQWRREQKLFLFKAKKMLRDFTVIRKFLLEYG